MSERSSSGHEDQVKTLWDYLAIARRRKWYFVLPAMAILAATVVITFSMPPVYRSIGTVLIEPPQLPQNPIKPDRINFLLLGFTGAFVGGFGAVFLRKGIDKGVRGARTVSETTNAPVLGAIPRIETAADRRRMRRNRVLVMLLLVGVAAAVAAVYFYNQPLDSLW